MKKNIHKEKADELSSAFCILWEENFILRIFLRNLPEKP